MPVSRARDVDVDETLEPGTQAVTHVAQATPVSQVNIGRLSTSGSRI